jgi:hypothetical protein
LILAFSLPSTCPTTLVVGITARCKMSITDTGDGGPSMAIPHRLSRYRGNITNVYIASRIPAIELQYPYRLSSPTAVDRILIKGPIHVLYYFN